MKLSVSASLWLLGMVLYLAPAQSQAQVITAGPDSVRVPVPADTAAVQKDGFFLSTWDKPAKAALFSAVIPGAGQVYNKAYWKVPIIYATGAVLTYFLIDNHQKYKDYEVALLQRVDGDTTTVDQYANNPDFPSLNESRGADAVSNLKYRRDYYRRNRDLTIILSVAAYSLQIAEAYVHAHLREFDVSEDLALRVQPNLLPVRSLPGSYTPGLTLTLYTRPNK